MVDLVGLHETSQTVSSLPLGNGDTYVISLFSMLLFFHGLFFLPLDSHVYYLDILKVTSRIESAVLANPWLFSKCFSGIWDKVRL